jgi:hypothetical protein
MLDKPSKQRPILFGGLLIAAVSSLPGLSLINCCCCAGIIFGGAFSTWLYQKDFRPEHPPLESSDALMVGLLAGLVGAAGATFLTVLFALVVGPIESELVASFMERVLDQLVENGSIPSNVADDVMQQMQDSMDNALSFGGLMASFFFNVIIFPIFGMLGGLIGYGLFRPKNPPVSTPV